MVEAEPGRDRRDAEARPPAGTPASGHHRCTGCGYGIAVRAELPACPMCRSRSWEPVPWAPSGGEHSAAPPL